MGLSENDGIYMDLPPIAILLENMILFTLFFSSRVFLDISIYFHTKHLGMGMGFRLFHMEGVDECFRCGDVVADFWGITHHPILQVWQRQTHNQVVPQRNGMIYPCHKYWYAVVSSVFDLNLLQHNYESILINTFLNAMKIHLPGREFHSMDFGPCTHHCTSIQSILLFPGQNDIESDIPVPILDLVSH